MAKDSGKHSFLDFFKMKDIDDEFGDDGLLDDDDEYDDDDEEYSKYSKSKAPSKTSNTSSKNTSYKNSYSTGAAYGSSTYKTQSTATSSYASAKPSRKVVDFNQQSSRQPSYGSNNVNAGNIIVIKPQEIFESQTVVDMLNVGKPVILNMEGLELASAQRIIDFIGGACYAIGGSLQAVSGNIFVAAPSSSEVTGDLREELLNDNTLTTQLGQF